MPALVGAVVSQSSRGSIVGPIRDSSGAVVSGASVFVRTIVASKENRRLDSIESRDARAALPQNCTIQTYFDSPILGIARRC